MEITGPHTANWTIDWLDNYGREVVDKPSYSPNLTPSDFHLFGPCKK